MRFGVGMEWEERNVKNSKRVEYVTTNLAPVRLLAFRLIVFFPLSQTAFFFISESSPHCLL